MLPFLVSREDTFSLILLRNPSYEASPGLNEVRENEIERERETGRGGILSCQTGRKEDGDLRREQGARRKVKAVPLISCSPAGLWQGHGRGQTLTGNCTEDQRVDSETFCPVCFLPRMHFSSIPC